ncbi:MAG: PEP-CTERM sorting domain-containing protein, partial [Phycisphaerales bacterium]|nr:PEP-CTERM sorting domain-containing protein [Phycisphaerales bacterium]
LGTNIGDIGKLEILQGASLNVAGGAYVGFAGLGTLNLASGAQVSARTMTIGQHSSLQLHVGGADMVILGNAAATGSMTNNGSIGLYADAFLAGGSYTPISAFSGGAPLWSGSGAVKAFGGEWRQSVLMFDVSPLIPLDAHSVHSVTSHDRLLITDPASGDQVSVSFGDIAGTVNFSASVVASGDQSALEAILPTNWSLLAAWDFATNLPDGNEVFLAFEVGSDLDAFQVWHLDGGVWSRFDPEFMSYDAAGGIAGFTVDGFSGYAVTTPEPGTLALLSLGGVIAMRRKRRRQK